MTVRHFSRTQPSQAAKRHRFDYAFRCCELRSVQSTAAAEDNFFPQAVDATACRKESLLVLAVYVTSASCAYSR
jgi:hypothetical protein